MNYFFTCVLCSLFLFVNGKLYDRANGNEIVEKAKKDQCAVLVKLCGPHEDRRVDGTCNNYGIPAGGASGGPYLRIAKPQHQNSNRTLPTAWYVRTSLLSQERDEGQPGVYLSAAASSFFDLIRRDISAFDAKNDKEHRCCDPKGKADPRCFPVLIPGKDPMTDGECMEFYRAKTFKDLGCAHNTEEIINFQTPTLDLSPIYGVDENSHKKVRKGENGLLNEFKADNDNKNGSKAEVNSAKTASSKKICVSNANDTVCYMFGFPNANNFDVRTAILGTWFIREHNRLARSLLELNPCWKDDRLFKVARSINIATIQHIFANELAPLFMGFRNMVNSGVVSQQIDYVTPYVDAAPLVYAEYEIAMEFFLTLRNGRIKKYDDNNRYIGDLAFNESMYHLDLLGKGKNYDEISRGMFIQKSGKVDSKLEPEIGEAYYNENEKAPDLFTAGIQRGRDMRVLDYNSYREICGIKSAKKFDDFSDTMPSEKLEVLKKLYPSVNDVDLISGIISEHPVHNGLIGPTLYCIMAKQLHLFRYSDRFWYERGDQAHSFDIPQLREIKKSNMAKLACNNSPAIEFIQPHAFQITGPGNMPLPCSFISGPDLTAWWDNSCDKRHLPTSFSNTKDLNPPYSYIEMLTFFDEMLKKRNISSI